MKKLAIVFCFGLAAACGGTDSGTSTSTGGGGSGGGGGSSTAVVGSCSISLTAGNIQSQTCYDVTAGTANSTALASVSSNCQSLNGTWAKTACSRTNSIGGCQQPIALTGAIQTTWYFPPTVADDVKKLCEAAGGTVVSP